MKIKEHFLEDVRKKSENIVGGTPFVCFCCTKENSTAHGLTLTYILNQTQSEVTDKDKC